MSYTIKNHKLIGPEDNPVIYQKSPNQSGLITPRYLIIHATGGRSFQKSVNYLCKKSSKVSAHFVIGRGGEVAQLVDADRKAWHAGRSSWNGLKGLNSHSLGLELDNSGKLTLQEDGVYKTWFKTTVLEENVVCIDGEYYHKYTDTQLETLYEVSKVLIEEYELEDVLGHFEIAPKRKVDPYVSFNMKAFRKKLFLNPEDYYDEEKQMCMMPEVD